RVGLGHNAVDGRFHVGTVIADKDHERAFRPATIRKRIDFAIDTLKGEIPGLPADRMGCVQYHQAFSTIEAPPNKDRFASLQNFTRSRSPRNSRLPDWWGQAATGTSVMIRARA